MSGHLLPVAPLEVVVVAKSPSDRLRRHRKIADQKGQVQNHRTNRIRPVLIVLVVWVAAVVSLDEQKILRGNTMMSSLSAEVKMFAVEGPVVSRCGLFLAERMIDFEYFLPIS